MNQLIRLIYASKANFASRPPENGVEPTVARILMQSRQNNTRSDIGGVLYFGDGHFFQALEGDRDGINATYRKIQRDPRHTDVTMLSLKSIQQRVFGGWSMKYVPAEQEVRGFLISRGYIRFSPLEFNEDTANALIQFFGQQHGVMEGETRSAVKLLWRKLFRRNRITENSEH
ncbi:BLUF domain-containing protein [Microbulbifer hainanensis]|uniref:BLUF domain-containing protein n=1 Tax=Microbulbifer hainanensis TaxID=2735675 RepID=UPI001867604E|nr:BLUF domain-containing protein [Microbulbifer hainanensis]